MTTDRDIARWRLRSQYLVRPHARSADAVIRSLLAVQAENASQAAWAVAGRTQDADAADLVALLDKGEVIRTHVLRPTWHFVAADDIGWLLDLTVPRVRPVFIRQLETLGVTGAGLDHAASVVLDALSERPDQTREQLAAYLREHGVEPGGQLLMLLVGLLELDQLVCSGRRVHGASHTYALFADRVPAPRRLDRAEALAELALRYFSGHGPATERDLAYWATLTLTDVRLGLAQVRDRLACFEHDGRVFWHALGESPPKKQQSPTGHLLQILDEIYRGYQDSRMVLDSDGIIHGGREAAIGMALVDAQIVAGMKRKIGRGVVFEISPYAGELRPSQLATIEQAAARYAAFLGLEYGLVVR